MLWETLGPLAEYPLTTQELATTTSRSPWVPLAKSAAAYNSGLGTDKGVKG